MKIKIKKEMNLPELIQWAWENPELATGKSFYTKNKDDKYFVYCSLDDGRKCLTSDFITPEDTFEVDIEEKVTKDTVFNRLFEVYEFPEGEYDSASYRNASINERLNDIRFPIKAYYILNDDLTMTLIWKDGELVE